MDETVIQDLNSDGSDEIDPEEMGSLPQFELSDGPNSPQRVSTTSLINQIAEKSALETTHQSKNRISGSLVITSVTNYGLISEEVANQMMRSSFIRRTNPENSKLDLVPDEASLSNDPSTQLPTSNGFNGDRGTQNSVPNTRINGSGSLTENLDFD